MWESTARTTYLFELLLGIPTATQDNLSRKYDEAEKVSRTNRVRLRQSAFARWIVIDATNESMAWSGSRFVPIKVIFVRIVKLVDYPFVREYS